MGLHGSDADAAVFGPYRLEGLLGRGGMGEVHRAYDTGRDRVVALKLLPPQLAGDTDFTARFRRESRLAARLRDPHVVPIHDFGEVDGRLFIDMRLVEGTDLADLLAQRRRLDPAHAVHVVSQVAAALDAAHREGLVHRDVKPSNVLVTGDAHVYLTDFGIAHSPDATALTGTGTALGTVHYMAPVRFLQGRSVRRMEVYSLGCLLHEVLTGRRPFPGDDVAAQMYAHVNLPPPRPSALVVGLPPGLDEVVARAMAKDPAQRFDTAGALAAAARAAAAGAATPSGIATPSGTAAHGSSVRPAASFPPPYRAGPPGSVPPGPLPPGSLPGAPLAGGPGAPRDPWRRRALVAAAIAAVSLLTAVAAIGATLDEGEPGEVDDGAFVESTTAVDPEDEAPSAAVRAPAVLTGTTGSDGADDSGDGPVGRIGEPVRDGGIQVTVTAARYADAVDLGNDHSGYTPTPAGADARYVVVEATVLNDTAESISPGCGGGLSTAVLDDRDRRFDKISETSRLRGHSAACIPAVQPGFTADVTFAYRVPAGATVSRFVFEDQADFESPEAGSPGVALGL